MNVKYMHSSFASINCQQIANMKMFINALSLDFRTEAISRR